RRDLLLLLPAELLRVDRVQVLAVGGQGEEKWILNAARTMNLFELPAPRIEFICMNPALFPRRERRDEHEHRIRRLEGSRNECHEGEGKSPALLCHWVIPRFEGYFRSWSIRYSVDFLYTGSTWPGQTRMHWTPTSWQRS